MKGLELLECTEAEKLAIYIKRQYTKSYGREISPIKLQKSLYFLFAYWGKFITENKQNKDSVEVDYSEYNEFLFDDRIEAWTYGPVIPSVFSVNNMKLLDINKQEDYLENDPIKKEFIDNLLVQLFEIDDFGLVNISHQDECWRKNYIETDVKHNREIKKEEIIDEYIKAKIK